MKRLVPAYLLLISLCLLPAAHAAGGLADVALIDRSTGERLETYYRHGEYWVAAEPGRSYTIYLRNRLGERLLAVTSVDGVNAVTGQSAGWDQAGYVLDPWEDYQITGWRKSDYQVAAFAFAAAPNSYAARTGRPENIGVIGIALFRERPIAEVLPHTPEIANADRAPAADAGEGIARAQSAPEPYSPPAAAPEPSARERAQPSGDDLASNALGTKLGTAHGAREYSYVAHTQFVRRQPRPDEIIRIRYDRLETLIALGIVRPHQRYPAEWPTPFPSSDAERYVPDPPPFSDYGAPR